MSLLNLREKFAMAPQAGSPDPQPDDSAPDIGTGLIPVVEVSDPRPPRRDSVERLVVECGGRTRRLRNPQAGAEQSRIALIAAGEPPPACAGEELVRCCGERGSKVVCYEDGAACWPLSARCKLLLAGAVSLLDSAAPAFLDDLHRWLLRLLQAETTLRVEEAEIAAILREVGMVAESAAMISVLRLVLRASRLSDVPTLISGETGTGKELIARAIHLHDPKRRLGPFLAVNCGAISPALAETELFGHRKGAFTGAERHRQGLFRSAHGGILFLDEISELELPLQAKLLRVLQEGRVLRVGDDEESAVDVRVVAASNRDLEAMVGEHEFRADLFHRLNVVPIRIPALRDRAADLVPLLRHFLRKYGSDGPSEVDPDPEVIDALREMPFPGNVRELENLVRAALVRKHDEGPLRLCDLPEWAWRRLAEPQGTETPLRASIAPDGGGGGDLNLSRVLAGVEKRVLQAALLTTHGNQTETARLLGITPRSVYNKLRKYHLEMKAPGN